MARLALRDLISENDFALRRELKSESIKGYFPSPLEMEEMSVEDIMTEIPVEDLRYVGSVKGRIYMPALFFQKWALPTIRWLNSRQKRLISPIIRVPTKYGH
jgi:hypothetical protein